MDKPMNDPYNQDYYNGNYHNDGNYNQTTTDANAPGYLLVFLVIVIFGGYLCEICRGDSGENDQITETITRPLNLEKQKITDSLLLSEECVICLGKYEKKDKITKLKCNHVFHHVCMVEWTQKNKSCPLCRIELL
jgi:hypothetical protein